MTSASSNVNAIRRRVQDPGRIYSAIERDPELREELLLDDLRALVRYIDQLEDAQRSRTRRWEELSGLR